MAKNFNLTAEINLRGPANIKTVVADIKRQLGSFSSNVNLKIDPAASKNISNITKQIQAMSSAISAAQKNTQSLSSSLKGLSTSLASVQSTSSGSSAGLKNTAQSATAVAKAAKQASSRMEEFGKQSALAIKRFAAFSVVTTGVYALINAITSGTKAFIEFDREIVRLQQVTGKSRAGLGDLIDEVTRLSTNLGVSSASLIEVASTLAQAGFNARDTQIALEALAKTELAPSFDNLKDTTEGAIAALRQFGLQTSELESALGSINAVAAAFAVESSDIIAAIQRTGGVFAASSRGVSEGTDALNEFIAVFTSVRATTRESAETIATGLRTIFTRIQRAQTIEQLKAFGVELTDLEGKFVGPFEATRRLSEALNQLDPRDIRFATIVEELGGFRQIGKVIPLIQQFATAQEALKVAQRGQDSLTSAQVIAQQSLANQLAKVREQFLALIRDIGQSKAFQNLFKLVINLSSGLISLVGAFKPILPLLSLLAAVKGVGAITKFAGGFLGALGGAGAADTGRNIGSSITGTKEKDRVEATARAVDALRSNTDAIKNLTLSVNALNSTMKSGGSSDIGSVRKFARGGFVPGSGNRDTVPAMLTPGEFVIRKKAVETIGADKLHKINKYGQGGVASIKNKGARDGDSWSVDYTPSSDPISATTRGIGYDAYEVGKGMAWEKKLGDRATEIANEYFTDSTSMSNKSSLFQSIQQGEFTFKRPLHSVPGSLKKRMYAEGVAKPAVKDNTATGSGGPTPEQMKTLKKLGFNTRNLQVQKFLKGGTVEETAALEGLGIQDSILAWIKELGGIQKIKNISGIPSNDRTLDGILRSNSIKSGDESKLQKATDAINKALSNKVSQKTREAQSINKAIKLAVVGLEPLGYSDNRIFDTGFGKAALLLRGLPNEPMYAEIIDQTKRGINQLSTNLATGMQTAGAFSGNKPIALDFDETLVSGADIFDSLGNIDISAYSDLNKVKQALQNGKLTPLAEKLKSILEFDPSFIDKIRILTARDQSNAPLLAQRLKELGLPISANKITGTSGGGATKATALGVGEKLIDDNYENILAAIRQGKTAKQYAELRDISEAESRASGIANAEGAILQIALAKLGAQGGTVKEAALDFEKGLGLQASQIFGLPPDIPTEVKRTLSSAAIGRAEDEFRRYFSETYGPFAKGSDVYGISKTTGLPVSRFADGGEVISRGSVKYLKSDIEKAMQSIGLSYDDFFKKISAPNSSFDQFMVGGFGPEAIEFPKNLRPYTPKSFVQEEMEKASAAKNARIQAALEKRGQRMREYEGRTTEEKIFRRARGFAAGGGISGQDTVPALLTPGEFVINKKAAQKIGYGKLHKLNKADKLSGYNKGGIVGDIQRFFVGGIAEKNVERAQGSVLTNIKQAEKAFAIGLGSLGKNIKDLILDKFKGIESVAAGQKTSLGTKFQEETRGQVAFGQGGSSVIGLQLQGKKVQATTETVMHETGHLADFALGGKKEFASKTAGTFQFDLVEKVKPIMEKAFKESGISSKTMLKYLTSNQELFAEFFAKASPEVRAIITSTTDAKIGMQKLKEHLEKVGHTYAGLEASDIDIGNQNQATGTAAQTQITQASNAQNNALLLAAERLEYFAYKAKQAGLTVEQYQRKLARETSQLAKDLQKDLKSKQQDLKYSIINMQGGLQGRSRNGSDTDKSFIRKAEEVILQKLTAINPDPATLKDMENAAAAVVDQMLKTGQTFDTISSTVSEVADAMKKPLNASEALGEALVIMAERTGVAVDILEEQIADRAQRMQTTAGNIIAGLEEVVDGLGGPIRVVGIAMTIVGDQIRRLVTSLDSNTKQNAALMSIMGGFIGAAQGMVAGQVLGSEGGRLLERIFPNVEGLGRRFELAATVTGTLIGAINGAADAYHRAQLDKVLNGVAESGRKVDLAFENLAKNNTPEAFKQAQDALLEGANNFVSLADQANFGAGGTSRTTLEWMRGLDPTGITASVSGQATEQEARDQFINAISGQVERARQLGDIRMTRVRGEDVTRSVGRMQEFDKQIQEQREAGNEGAVKAIQEERTKFLSTSSQVFGQLRQIYKTDSDAFLALYTEQAQRSGKTAEQISDAIKTPEGLENAIKEGQRISAMYAEQEQRARLLSDAMRNVAVQTENVINTYRMIGAALDRFGQSIERIKDDAINAAAAFRGEAKIGKVKRTDEEIFGNISGFSMQEVGGAAARAGKLAGGGKFGTQLEQRIVGAKALQDELPRILQGISAQNADEAIDQLSAKFKEMNIELDPTLLKELENTLRQRLTGQKEGTTVAELASDPELLNNLSKVGEAALKVASQLSKTFYDAFQGVIDLTNEYGKALEQATEWQLKAADIRAKADIQLADALGESLSLDELNAPIDARIRSLSSSSVLPGGSTDPEKLAKSIKDLAAQRQIAEADLAEKLLAVQSAQTDEERTKAKQAVDDQVRFMAEQNQQINNTTKALEELANDSSAAANALQKLQDFRATTKAGVNLAQKVLTAEPEELLNINKQLAAYNKTITGQATPRDMANVQFRQQAFGGLDMLRSVMPEKIAQQMQARMSRQMLTSMGVDLGQTIAIGPDNQQISLDQALTNVETGTDPQQQAYIDAYRAATERQAAAADRLGEAAIIVASTFTDAATKITEQLINNLPQTVQQTAKEAEPPPKPEEQPKPEDKAAEPLVVNIVPDERQISILDTIKNQGLESTKQIVEAIGGLSTALVSAIGTMFAQSAIDSIVDRTIGNLSGRIFGGRGGGAMDMGRLATAGRGAGTGAAQAAGTVGTAAGRGLVSRAAGGVNAAGRAVGGAVGGTSGAAVGGAVATGAGAIYGGYVLTDWIMSVGELVTDFDNKMAEIGDRAQKQAGKSYISQVIQNLAEPGDALIQLFSEIGQIGSYAAKEIGKQIGIVKNELALADKRLREIRAKDAGADAVNYNELGVVAQTRAKFQAEAQLSLNKAQKIKASGGSAEDVSKAVGFNIGGSIDKFIELQQSKIADYMKLEGGDSYNKAVAELLSKMEQDNAKMGQMADEATKPGSIYTHDTHCEKVLYEILSVLSGKKVDQPVTRQQISEGIASGSDAYDNLPPETKTSLAELGEWNRKERKRIEDKKASGQELTPQESRALSDYEQSDRINMGIRRQGLIPQGGMSSTVSPDASTTRPQDPNVLSQMTPKPVVSNNEISRSKDTVFPQPTTSMNAQQEQQRLAELKKKGAYRISNSGLPMGRSYEEQGEYQKLQAKYRSPYEQAKLARRQAYLNRFRPEVRERMLTEDEKAQRRYNQTASSTASVSAAPVPVTRPQAAAPTQTQPTAPTTQQGYSLTIDQKSTQFLENLTSTFNSFGNYIENLERVTSNIPSKIDLVLVAEPVEVNVKFTGAAVIEELKKSPEVIRDLVDQSMVNEVNNKIQSIQKWIKNVSGVDLNSGS